MSLLNRHVFWKTQLLKTNAINQIRLLMCKGLRFRGLVFGTFRLLPTMLDWLIKLAPEPSSVPALLHLSKESMCSAGPVSPRRDLISICCSKSAFLHYLYKNFLFNIQNDKTYTLSHKQGHNSLPFEACLVTLTWFIKRVCSYIR